MLPCYYFMIVKQLYSNMATLFDHLNSNSLDKLNDIKKSYKEKEAKLEAERRRINKERAEKYGFKNYDEVIDWLKSGNCVNTIDGSLIKMIMIICSILLIKLVMNMIVISGM